MSLYGIYDSHSVEACPVNNLENAKKLVSFGESDPAPLLAKYRIGNWVEYDRASLLKTDDSRGGHGPLDPGRGHALSVNR